MFRRPELAPAPPPPVPSRPSAPVNPWPTSPASHRPQASAHRRENQIAKAALQKCDFPLGPASMSGTLLPPGCSIVPNGGRTEGRKVGDAPASSKCFDEEHTRVQPTPQDINGVSLVGEFDRLRGEDLKIRVHPTFITIGKKLERFLR